MSVYQTNQRKVLLDFLNTHSHEAFSAAQIVAHFKDEKISVSSIYRNLTELEQSGEIRRVGKSKMRGVYYQYTHAQDCKDKIHLVCLKCEQSIHMSMDNAQTLSNKISQYENFEIDKNQTIIYGLCKNCQ